MSKTVIPQGYKPATDLYETQKAIAAIKGVFQKKLSDALNLTRVSAPLFVEAGTGVNDDLNGVERPVSFDIMETKSDAQVVHSLAKWKRLALYQYGFQPGTGLYTDMNAIRRDEEMDNLHSIYVDQWDWEKIITPETRNFKTLQRTVKQIVQALKITENKLHKYFPQMKSFIEEKVTFITSEELLQKYPGLSPKERENAVCKEFGTVFITQIGKKLSNGERHDGRAPDYDDWELNGDLLVWYPVLDRAIELSSMGIRVDVEALKRQLKEAGCEDRKNLEFHRMLLNGELPLTMGGGIGQSRLCMVLLHKAHIGEVQASIWDQEMIDECAKHEIILL